MLKSLRLVTASILAVFSPAGQKPNDTLVKWEFVLNVLRTSQPVSYSVLLKNGGQL